MSFETTTAEVLDGVDLSGKIAVVTGASTGIGLETARALAAAGAHVVLAGRDAARIDAAVSTVRDQVPDAELEAGSLDLASLDSVRAFAQWYSETHDRLHLLINNAGVMYTPLERTAEGFEMQFGTNHVGHFLLTNLLVPMLLADPPSRIVNLSSGGHRGSDIVWDDPNYERREYDKFSAYGQSKTANILFSVELERRLADRGVHAYTVHPGMIATELGRHMTEDDFAQMVERAKRAPSGGLPPRKTVEQGAATSVWAATAPELDEQGGTYLADTEVTDELRPLGPRPRVGRAPLDPLRGPRRPAFRPPLRRKLLDSSKYCRVGAVEDVARTQRALEQLDRLRASRNGHAGALGRGRCRSVPPRLRAVASDRRARTRAARRARPVDGHGRGVDRPAGAQAAGARLRRRGPRTPTTPRGRGRDHAGRASRRAPAHRRRARSATCATCSTAGRPPTAARSATCSSDSSTTSAPSSSATRPARPTARGAPHDHAHRHRGHRPDDRLSRRPTPARPTTTCGQTTHARGRATVEFPAGYMFKDVPEPARRRARPDRGHASARWTSAGVAIGMVGSGYGEVAGAR